MGRALPKDVICPVCGREFITGKSGSLVCSRCVNRKLRSRKLKLVNLVKGKGSCAICGEDDEIVLQFHHKYPEQKWKLESKHSGTPNAATGVSGLVWKSASISKVKEEIEKCVLLCANCHLRVEAGEESVEDIETIIVPTWMFTHAKNLGYA